MCKIFSTKKLEMYFQKVRMKICHVYGFVAIPYHEDCIDS